MKSIFYFVLVMILHGCANNAHKDIGDSIYFGGTILTMEDTAPTVEAVVVKEGQILFAGSKSEEISIRMKKPLNMI